MSQSFAKLLAILIILTAGALPAQSPVGSASLDSRLSAISLAPSDGQVSVDDQDLDTQRCRYAHRWDPCLGRFVTDVFVWRCTPWGGTWVYSHTI